MSKKKNAEEEVVWQDGPYGETFTLSMSCECYSEEIRLVVDKHIYDEMAVDPDEDPCIYASVWSTSGVGCYGLWTRLRCMWHVLWTGSPFRDQFVLSPKNARKWAAGLLSASKRVLKVSKER